MTGKTASRLNQTGKKSILSNPIPKDKKLPSTRSPTQSSHSKFSFLPYKHPRCPHPQRKQISVVLGCQLLLNLHFG